MGYVRTGGMSTAARRRRRRTGLVLTALVALLAAVFVYAAAYYQGWLGDDAAPRTDASVSTATATEEPLQPSEISVNVYNANGAPGLAAGTAEAITARGFVVDAIDNDPEDATIEGVADIRHGPTGEAAARVLQEAVPGAELVPDGRESAVIDLVLGDGWEALPEVPAQTGTED